MVTLHNGKIKASAILGFWQMDAILMNILPFHRQGLRFPKAGEQNEFKIGFMNWVEEAICPVSPSG